MAIGQVLGQLFKVGLQVGTSFLGSQLAAKQEKAQVKAFLQRRLTQPMNGGGNVPVDFHDQQLQKAIEGGSATVPAWHGAVHRTGKRRRTNYANTKALNRALRRAEGFVRLVKRTEKMRRRIAPPSPRRSTTRKAVC